MQSGLSVVDFLVIIGYLVIIAVTGSLSGGKQKSTKDYFLGGSDVPWWAVAFSIVAAETSTLTFISIPGLAYVANLNFLQVTFGYLIGRIIISFIFLPAYKTGNLTTAYGLLETRFGSITRKYASIVFLFTRIAADGVRLFATSIPLAMVFSSFPIFANFSTLQIYLISIIIISVITLVYTYTGGMKGIIWVDVIQMSIYLGGSLIALIILINKVPGGFASVNSFASANKFAIFNFHFEGGLRGFFSTSYTFWGSIIGGTFLSMATHGTDQLIVQRLLSTKNLKDSKKAIITSGIIVIFQFVLFLLVGLLLFAFYKGLPLGSENLPFTKADEIFPFFIIHHLPTGIRGLIIAGLFAAAMSTLAGSMSSLSSAAMMDLYKPVFGKNNTPEKDLKISRLLTIFWAVVLTVVAFLFIKVLQSVVEIALGIASITYGGLLGTFILGTLFKKIKQRDAIIGFTSGILTMLGIILIPMLIGIPPIVHWTWYTLIGCIVTVITANISNLKK